MDNDDALVSLGSAKLQLPELKAAKVKEFAGKPVHFGIRPEFISLAKESTLSASNVVNGKIIRVENMGHELFVHVEIAGNEFTARIDAYESRDLLHNGVGKELPFEFDLTHSHIFDSETERNISL